MQISKIQHSRKGTFYGVVTDVDDTWADVEITDGKAKHLTEGDREKGETLRVRKSLCRITPVGGES